MTRALLLAATIAARTSHVAGAHHRDPRGAQAAAVSARLAEGDERRRQPRRRRALHVRIIPFCFAPALFLRFADAPHQQTTARLR
jgi:hypothetical protein